LFHKAEHHRKPKAGALALFLGGEERFEEPGPGGRIHADAGIADGEHHVAARRHADVAAGVFVDQF
jgi:hypothetical protein